MIYPQVKKYYDYEKDSFLKYPPTLQGGGLLHAICYHFGIKVKIIDYPFFKELDNIFSISHIGDIVATAKSFDLETCELKKVC